MLSPHHPAARWVVLAAAACFLATSGALPDSHAPHALAPCCLPPVWEGRLSYMAGQVHKGDVISYLSDGSLHVDTKNNRMAVNQALEVNGRRVNVTIIDLVSENVTYIIIKDRKSCIRHPSAAINNCIPSTATYLGRERLGAGTGSIEVDTWGVHLTVGMNIYAKAAVTKDTCIPVFQSTFGDVADTKVMRSDHFYDVHEGIVDAHVFDVPDYCRKSPSIVFNNKKMLSLMTHHRIRRAVMV